ncbi:MAG: hypothetical protein O2787_01515 [Cyanobacteria bacterium]|nr:hypothetical protein [Cyanobacteriota bacterium]
MPGATLLPGVIGRFSLPELRIKVGCGDPHQGLRGAQGSGLVRPGGDGQEVNVGAGIQGAARHRTKQPHLAAGVVGGNICGTCVRAVNRAL